MQDKNIPVYSTKDYEKFSFVQANREINERHLENLTESIRRKNLLSICPVIVSENMEVIDGQHRIEAAKTLNEEIFYITSKGLSLDDILSLNNVRKPWGIADFFNFYYTQKVSGFKEVNDLIVKTGWSLNQICSVVSVNGVMNVSNIKAGKMDISNIDKAETIINAVNDFENAAPNAYNKMFIRAVRWLISGDAKTFKIVKKYNHAHMKDFLSRTPNFSMVKYLRGKSKHPKHSYFNYKQEIEGAVCSYNAISYIYMDIFDGRLK